jgi:hypothetical protein
MRGLSTCLAGGVLLASVAVAQAPAPKAPAAKAPGYDIAAVVTVTGVVRDHHESTAPADHPGLHLVVQVAAETEPVEVHTCPMRFLKALDFAVETGDTLTIVGSRPSGGPIVVARELKKGNLSLNVRDAKGEPLWLGF